MTTDKLQAFKAVLDYRTLGAKYKQTFRANAPDALKPASPADTMVHVAGELARIAELYGFGAELEAEVKAARERVVNWKRENQA